MISGDANSDPLESWLMLAKTEIDIETPITQMHAGYSKSCMLDFNRIFQKLVAGPGVFGTTWAHFPLNIVEHWILESRILQLAFICNQPQGYEIAWQVVSKELEKDPCVGWCMWWKLPVPPLWHGLTNHGYPGMFFLSLLSWNSQKSENEITQEFDFLVDGQVSEVGK